MNKLPKLSLFLLGPSQITLDGRPVAFRTNKVQALLCYLAVETTNHPGIAIRREALMTLLWPDMPLKSAQDNLRQTLYQLRKAIPKTAAKNDLPPQPLILSDRLSIQINPACTYELDVAKFQTLVGPTSGETELEQAAALYRGDFLADLYLIDSSDFEEWSAARRLGLRSKALDTLDRLTVLFSEQGKFHKAESFVRRQLEIDNLRESAHCQLMTVLVENGRRAEALQQYKSCRKLLLEELGIEPSAETTALYEQIRTTGTRKPDPAPPAVSRTTPRRQRRHNLPAQTTSFVGRHQELADVVNLLSDPNCRLLTLHGPGGIGKTRLSLQVASTLAQSESDLFPDGVFLVPLAAIPKIEYLIPAIADATGFSFSGPREPQSQVMTYLKTKKILLVLDNLEHLAGEAGLLADFLTPILMGVPGLTFLVTSRVRLNLYEEWRFELAGLEVPVEPDTTDLEKYSAVQLFIQRARQAGLNVSMERDLPVIGRICHLLAGLPLGIELAAGWVRTHTCDQIAAEIERNLDFLSTTIQNVPERHRSLQVAFEHSWRLLPVEAKQIFARLTIFRGGFVSEAAEFVAGASRTTLARLVDNSMLHVVGGRYQMNELLRQFGAEKLAAVGAAGAYEHHADYFATFIEQRQQHKWTAEEPAALDEISLELKNILVGWRWVISQLNNPAQMAAVLNLTKRYTPMLAHYYEQKSRFHEGFQLFHNAARKIAAADGDSSPQKEVALSIVKAAEAVLRFHLSQFSEVEKLLQESLEIFRQNHNHYETAAALARLGMTANRMGHYQDSGRYLQESLALFHQLEDRIGSAEALNGLGILAISEEKFDDGWRLLQESLAVYRESGYKRGIARALSNLGTVNVRRGNYNQVLPLYEEALAAARAINDVMVIAAINSNLGSISRILGNHEESLRYYEESLIMFREMDERRWIAASLNGLGETLIHMEQLDTAQQRLRQALEISTAIQSVPDILDSLAGLGDISAVSGSQEAAVAVLTFVLHHPVAKPLARERGEQVLAQLEREMPEELWQAAQARGFNAALEDFTAEFLGQM